MNERREFKNRTKKKENRIEYNLDKMIGKMFCCQFLDA